MNADGKKEKEKSKRKRKLLGKKRKLRGQKIPLFSGLRFFVSFFFPLVSEMNHPLVALFLQANCVLTRVV